MKPGRARDRSRLTIYRGDALAGELLRTEEGCSFSFAPSFLGDGRFSGLSYRIPKDSRPIVFRGANLHPFFAGLLPEGLRLNALLRNLKTSADDLFTLFAAAGGHTIGDVYAQDARVHASSSPPPKLREIDFHERFASLIAADPYSLGEDAIAGIQEKVSASMISFPLNIAKSTKAYIVKLNPPDKPNLVENEFCCMALAKRCGLDVANAKLVRDKNRRSGLLVERFDRVWRPEAGGFGMLHQEDACQYLDRFPADKYRLSFNDVLKGACEQAASPRATALKLIRLYCFSYLIGNGDLHAKNVSLLSTQDGLVDSSPAYDLISTRLYGDEKMALKLDGKDEGFHRKAIVAFATRFGLPNLATERMLDRLLRAFGKNASLLQAIPADRKKLEFLARFSEKRARALA